jgi:hypothetical protein
MTKFCLVLVGLVACWAASINAQEQAAVPIIKAVKPPFVKIRVEDTGSRLLGKEEVDRLKADQIVEPKAVKAVEPLTELKPATQIESKPIPAVAVDSVPPVSTEEKLPPIPISPLLIPGMPTLFQTILDSMPKFGMSPIGDDLNKAVDSDATGASPNDAQPRKIISVLLMKHANSEESSSDQQSADQTPPKSASFFIFKFLPKFRNNDDSADKPLMGGKDDPDHAVNVVGKLGGETDPDHQMGRPLLGGGGENDPDRIRFKLNPIFTGNDDLLMNKKEDDDDDNDDDDNDDDSDAPNNGPVSLLSLIDRIKGFFGQNGMFKNGDNIPMYAQQPQQIIIRTDDGQQAILPNEFGFGEPQPAQSEDPNKCMMLSFMRMKASMYYRTILHLLFFSGVLLFVLFMILLTVRSYKKKRYSTLRYYPHNMTVSTIDGSDEAGVKSSKFKFLRQWSVDQDTQLITSPDVKSAMINAPPGYDVPYVKVSSEPDTRSLPPEYEEQPQQENEEGKSQPKV